MNPSTDLRVRLLTRRSPSGITISIRGDLDIASTPELRERLLITLESARGRVIFDLSGITFCDAAGLAVLVGARRRASLLGLRTGFTGPSPQLHKLLRITGLDRTLIIGPAAEVATRPAHAGAA